MGIPTPREIQEKISRENVLIEFLQREMELREVKISLLRQLVQINEQLMDHLNSDPRINGGVVLHSAHCIEPGHGRCYVSGGMLYHVPRGTPSDTA